MKQASDDLASFLQSLNEALRLGAPLDRISAVAELLAWLAPSSSALGLTKYRDPHELATQLVAPALHLLSPDFSPVLRSPALDFGAGCGAVGLSIALLAPHIEVVLADRRARVVQFIDVASQRYHIANCRALLVDLSDPPEEHRNRFATVLVRAFGPAADALIQAQRWLSPEGHVVLWHRPTAPPDPDGLIRTRSEQTNLPSLVLSTYLKRRT